MNILNSIIEKPELAGRISVNINGNDLIAFARELAIQMRPGQTPIPPDEKYLTADETAEKLQVSRVTLWQWNRKGILKPRKVGNVLRYLESDVKAALTERS